MRAPTSNQIIDRAVAEIAQTQRGLFTYRQAIDGGWTEQRIDRRLRAKRIERVHHRVFAFAGSPRTWERAVQAAVLAGGIGAVASHEAAAALHGFPHVAPRGSARVVIAAPPTRDPRPRGVVVHRMLLPEHHVVQVDGIAATSFERTLVDMTGTLGMTALARSLDAGLVAGAVELARLRRMLEALGPAPGRRLRVLRILLDERGPEAEMTESTREIRLLSLLRAAGLRVPEPQYKVSVAGAEFRFDAAYPDLRVGLEYLGWDPHRTRIAFDHDFRRDRLLSLAGWTILYFTSASSDAEIVRDVGRLLHSTRDPEAEPHTRR